MQLVTDSCLLEQLRETANSIVDCPWYLRTDLIQRFNWVIIPVEKGRHFEEEESKRVATAIQNLVCINCYAVVTEPYYECYSLLATMDDLEELSETCAGLNCLLFSEELSYAILCTSEDYNLYAGSPQFVEQCLGCDLDSARKTFKEIASDEWWEGKLLHLLERYSSNL